MHFIDDTTDVERYVHPGPPGLIPRNYDAIPLGKMPYTSPFAAAVPIIPESEWPDRIKAMQGKQIRHLYTGTVDEDNQDGLNYCWAFSLTQAIKASRDADVQPHVDLLAESLGRDVSWNNSGNYCGTAIACAAKFGVCDRSFSPKRYSLNPAAWKTGWDDEAKDHRVLEWWELGHTDMRAETVTALLLGFGVYVGLNWARHAMHFQEVSIVNGKLSIWTPNTWTAGNDWTLSGSKMVPDEAYVIRSTTFSEK